MSCHVGELSVECLLVWNLFRQGRAVGSVDVPQPPGDWRWCGGCCSARPALPLLSSSLCCALLCSVTTWRRSNYSKGTRPLHTGARPLAPTTLTSSGPSQSTRNSPVNKHLLVSKVLGPSGLGEVLRTSFVISCWADADERNEFHDLLSGVLKSGHQPG